VNSVRKKGEARVFIKTGMNLEKEIALLISEKDLKYCGTGSMGTAVVFPKA
jgi:hypothetical protein